MRHHNVPVVLAVLVFSCGAVNAASAASQPGLQAEAKISEADAKATALAKVPSGTISSSELEKEHGKLIWSFDIAKAGTKNVTEVHVDAKTGKILSEKLETPRKEKNEAEAEAREKIK